MTDFELMTRRSLRAAHVPRDILTDQIQVGLSLCARAVRVAAFLWGRSDADQRVAGAVRADVGWLVQETRQPFTAETFAHLTGWGVADVEVALEQLRGADALVMSDSGILGVAGWWPDAARRAASATRKHRQQHTRRAAA